MSIYQRSMADGLLTVIVLSQGCAGGAGRAQPEASPIEIEIPRTWDDEAVAAFELPLARPEFSPTHVSEVYYYQLLERTIWKAYPIYHPDHEPEGYRDRLLQREPEVVFDPADLVTEGDWIDAGALVFHAPISFDGPTLGPDHLLDARWYASNEIRLTAEGVFPYAQWVIRERGKLEVANLACAMCHTRLMPDGSVIEGAQGNFPLDEIIARRIQSGGVPLPAARAFTHASVGAPWTEGGRFHALSRDTLAAIRAAIPPGVMARQGTSFEAPAKVPDLIGIRHRKYLDATGLVIHRGIGDVMRYAASNQSIDMLARYGDFVPDSRGNELPPPGQGTFPGTADRYSDAQLFALAKFLYALEPPENPNPLDARTRRGQEVFETQGCPICHTPPLYTNNQLIPAAGFEPPEEHYEKYDVSEIRVDTDPTLATTTRRGTGYYKVPSLLGVWYRGPFEHSGSVATLEDWFDPARLREDYVPTGFAGTSGPHPVRGHAFGLELSDEDKRALIAFLKIL